MRSNSHYKDDGRNDFRAQTRFAPDSISKIVRPIAFDSQHQFVHSTNLPLRILELCPIPESGSEAYNFLPSPKT